MKNKLKIVILVFAASIFQGSCQQKNNTPMNKYEWLPTETAPTNYPIYLHQAYFKTKDDIFIRIPDKRTVYYGWGSTGSVHISGEDYKPVPNSVSLTWLSYTENKYYKTSFELPEKRISELFEKGFLNPKNNKRETYNRIGVGIAPGGLVVVWVMGTFHQIEVATGQGQITEIDFKEMIPSTEMTQAEFTEMILKEEVEDSVLKEIKAGEIPYKRWQDYRKKYDWKLALTHQEEFTPEHARISMLNGEQDVQYFDGKIKPLLENWAIPSSTRLQWRDENENLFAAQIYFDEKETTEAFKLLGGNDKKITISAQVARFNDSIQIQISNEDQEIPLQKAKIKIYSKTK